MVTKYLITITITISISMALLFFSTSASAQSVSGEKSKIDIGLSVRLEGQSDSGGATSNKSEMANTQGGTNICPHDPKSRLPCAGTIVPEPKNVEQFWQNFISMLASSRGYVLPERVERAFNIHLTKDSPEDDKHQFAQYEGGEGVPLSIRLDTYAPELNKQGWKRAQGELDRARSVLNISGGDFDCIPLNKAEKLLSDAGFTLQGSIIYQEIGFGKSVTIFADPNRPTTITLYYDRAVIMGPCVESVTVVGYK